MRFSVSSTDLLKKLQIAGGAIESNPVQPLLEDFLFGLSGNTLTVTATNLETSIILEQPVTGEEDGIIAVPARILMDTLKALPDQPITFDVDEESHWIEITSAFGKYRLAGDKAADYPEIPVVDEENSMEIKSDILIKAVNNTLIAASDDELRLAMTGVYFQIDFNKIIFVATDAHKLVKYTYDGIDVDFAKSFIVPKKGLSLLRNGLQGEKKMVNLSFNDANVFFQFDHIQFICRLVDAKFPNYNMVIPVDNTNVLTIGKKDIQHSLRRISIYSNKSTNQVVFNLNESSLTMSAQDLDFSNEATEQLPCKYDGEPMTIGFNAKFFLELLQILTVPEIKLELSDPTKACLLLPVEDEPGEELMMLVMPVMMGN
jgi:DNA polymerase-3 subunit beta